MKPKHPYGAVAVWSLMFFALMPPLSAQGVNSAQHNGAPQDWSHNHIVFSRAGLLQHPVYDEPRSRGYSIRRCNVGSLDQIRSLESRIH